jgi:hypothetical protein
MATPIFVKKAQASVLKRFAKLSFFCPFFRPPALSFSEKAKNRMVLSVFFQRYFFIHAFDGTATSSTQTTAP